MTERLHFTIVLQGFPAGSVGKEFTFNALDAGDMGSIPGSGRSPGGGHGNLLQYSYLENPTTEEPGTLQSIGFQSQSQLKQLSSHAY